MTEGSAPVITLPIRCLLRSIPGTSANVTGPKGREQIATSHANLHAVQRFISSFIVREDFLAIVGLDDALRFFAEYGAFDQNHRCSMETVRDMQRRIREARELPPARFFTQTDDAGDAYGRQHWSCRIQFEHRFPYLLFESHFVSEALWHATYADQIAGIRASTCPKCGDQFTQPQGRKEKTYCSPICQGRATKARWKQNHDAKKGRHGKA
jgi:hypothetical protein